jgi:hypothetical protein
MMLSIVSIKPRLASINIVYRAYRHPAGIPITVGKIIKEKPPETKHIQAVIGVCFLCGGILIAPLVGWINC